LKKICSHYKEQADRGSPCLTPLLQTRFLPGTPFRRIEVLAESRMDEV
jgi:hypothetical protein